MGRRKSYSGVMLFLFIIWSGVAFGAQTDAWKADWEKTLQAAKKEGRLVLYGIADYESSSPSFKKSFLKYG
jgi:hypothetical protein